MDLEREEVLGSVDTYHDSVHTRREKTANAIIICQAWVQVTDYYKGVLEVKSGYHCIADMVRKAWGVITWGGCQGLFPLVSPCGPQLAHRQLPQFPPCGFQHFHTIPSWHRWLFFRGEVCLLCFHQGSWIGSRDPTWMMTQTGTWFSLDWLISWGSFSLTLEALFNTRANALLKSLFRGENFVPKTYPWKPSYM